MSNTPAKPKPRCPMCGAVIQQPRLETCWLCGTTLPANMTASGKRRGSRLPDTQLEPRDHPAWAVFGVLALLLLFGLLQEAPGLLIVLLILLLPALIRMVLVTVRRRTMGEPRNILGAIGVFFTSLGMVAVVGLAAVAAFYAVCFAICLGGMTLADGGHGRGFDWIIIPSIGGGIVVGLTVLGLLIYYVFLRRR